MSGILYRSQGNGQMLVKYRKICRLGINCVVVNRLGASAKTFILIPARYKCRNVFHALNVKF